VSIQRLEPGPGQESVWDYPRPPRLERTGKRLRVEFNGVTVADTVRGHRVLETSQAPAYYFPPDDVELAYLLQSTTTTFCEWKGSATHHTLRVGDRSSVDAAWRYREPRERFAEIAGFFAFYPSRVDACYVDDDLARPMDGGFYGGWITADIVGPFKGGAGTAHW
jgi:uncharacterized protein (DUF427 family)